MLAPRPLLKHPWAPPKQSKNGPKRLPRGSQEELETNPNLGFEGPGALVCKTEAQELSKGVSGYPPGLQIEPKWTQNWSQNGTKTQLQIQSSIERSLEYTEQPRD